MQFADCVRSRKMVRAFRKAPVDSELLNRIVDLASRAPSAGKTQGWHLLLLRDEQLQNFGIFHCQTKNGQAFGGSIF